MNIVILTIGNTGSTVLVKMLKILGWSFDNNIQPDYEESKTVISLNDRLLGDGHVAPCEISQYVDSLEQPWIIKDPRLSVTFDFWKSYLEQNNTLLIWLRRDLTCVENSLRSRGWGCATKHGYTLWNDTLTLSQMDENNRSQFRGWKGPKIELQFEKLADAITQFKHEKIKRHKREHKMPPLEYADHYQNIVYWEASDPDAYGKPTVNSPIALKGRWEPRHSEILNAQGTRIAADVIVHVSRELKLGSIIRLGRLYKLPTAPDNLYEVVFYEETPSLKNRYINRAVFLRRFRDSLPTVN